jgi:hypothetical protein
MSLTIRNTYVTFIGNVIFWKKAWKRYVDSLHELLQPGYQLSVITVHAASANCMQPQSCFACCWENLKDVRVRFEIHITIYILQSSYSSRTVLIYQANLILYDCTLKIFPRIFLMKSFGTVVSVPYAILYDFQEVFNQFIELFLRFLCMLDLKKYYIL